MTSPLRTCAVPGTQHVSSGDSQGRADLAEYWKIENLSFLLKLVEALAAPDFSIPGSYAAENRGADFVRDST